MKKYICNKKLINNRLALNLVTFAILIFVPLLKMISFYFEKYKIFSDYDSINPGYILFFSVPFLLIIYIVNLIKSKRKLDLYDYIFYIFIVAGFIASMLAISKEISFLGKPYRHEGYLSMLSYYLLFINWKVIGTKKDLNRYINVIIIICIINSIYALLQIYTPFTFILRYTKDNSMATGFCGNPNFFGSLIVVGISMITTKYLQEEKNIKSNISIIILLFISLINCQSTGPFLTYMILLVLLFIFLVVKKKFNLKKIITLTIILLLTYGLVYITNFDWIKTQKCEMCEIKETIKSGGNGRIEIGKNSLDIVKNHWFVGVGYDNFCLAYPENGNATNRYEFIPQTDGTIKAVHVQYEIIDNAHNIYLQMLVSSGIIGLIPYLLLCLFTFIRGLKSKDNMVIILLSGFVAYSIQAVANISVIQVAPIYFLIIGLILSAKE